jgi:dimethylargininase
MKARPTSATTAAAERTGMPLTAITRGVSAAMADCELSFVDRSPIDIALARKQHAGYVAALRALGCDVLELPAQEALPDSVFVEDVALVMDEVAVMTRPGAESRRLEGASIADDLVRFRPLLRMEAPATLDGGDVLRIGRQVFVGESARSNPEGRRQLQSLLAPHGYTVQGVAMRDCLHLKSAVTAIADGRLLVNPRWVDTGAFAGFELIEVDPGEPHAANVLRIGNSLLYPDCFPSTAARLRAAGLRMLTVDVSELQKAEGAVTCCSLVFETA